MKNHLIFCLAALGFLAALIGMASPALGIFAALPVYAPLTFTLRIIEWQGAWQSASVPVFALGGLFALVYYALLFLITIMLNQTSDDRWVPRDCPCPTPGA